MINLNLNLILSIKAYNSILHLKIINISILVLIYNSAKILDNFTI